METFDFVKPAEKILELFDKYGFTCEFPIDPEKLKLQVAETIRASLEFQGLQMSNQPYE